MPKETNKKNNKGKTTTTKASTKKKTQTKKTVEKKENVKKVVKSEIKVEPKKVEEKVEEKVVVKEEKGNTNSLVEKVMNNTPFLVALCIIVVLLAVLIFVACSKKVPKTSDGNQIVATIKGKTITADDLYEELKEENGTNALIKIVDEYISEKEVKVTDDDKKYVDEVVDYYKNYAEYYGVDLPTFLSNYVGLNGISTEDEFYDYVLNDYKKTLAVVKFIGDNAKEEDLKDYYKENYTDKLTVKHILIEVDDETSEDAALAKAKKLIETLDKTSAKKLDSKFNELALDNSDDTSNYSNGGLIENFSKSDVVEEFWNAANELKDGEYTKEPVKTTYGYHVILRVSSTEAEKYEDIKDEVKKAYAQALLNNNNALLAEKWDELRKQYKLSIKDDFMKETYQKSLNEATKETEE